VRGGPVRVTALLCPCGRSRAILPLRSRTAWSITDSSSDAYLAHRTSPNAGARFRITPRARIACVTVLKVHRSGRDRRSAAAATCRLPPQLSRQSRLLGLAEVPIRPAYRGGGFNPSLPEARSVGIDLTEKSRTVSPCTASDMGCPDASARLDYPRRLRLRTRTPVGAGGAHPRREHLCGDTLESAAAAAATSSPGRPGRRRRRRRRTRRAGRRTPRAAGGRSSRSAPAATARCATAPRERRRSRTAAASPARPNGAVLHGSAHPREYAERWRTAGVRPVQRWATWFARRWRHP